jgi:hypothetical protein
MDLQRKLLISATNDIEVKLRRIEGTLEEFKDAFFIPAGSKSVKTFK